MALPRCTRLWREGGAVAGDDHPRDPQHSCPGHVDRCAVRSEWVLRRALPGPPQMRQRDHSICGAYEGDDVLRCVAWCLDQPNGGRELEALGGAHLPGVSAVDRPMVMNPCVREQRRVQGVIGMMVGEDDIGDVLRAYSPVPQGFQDRGRAGDEAWVDDDLRVAVPEVGHG